MDIIKKYHKFDIMKKTIKILIMLLIPLMSSGQIEDYPWYWQNHLAPVFLADSTDHLGKTKFGENGVYIDSVKYVSDTLYFYTDSTANPFKMILNPGSGSGEIGDSTWSLITVSEGIILPSGDTLHGMYPLNDSVMVIVNSDTTCMSGCYGSGGGSYTLPPNVPIDSTLIYNILNDLDSVVCIDVNCDSALVYAGGNTTGIKIGGSGSTGGLSEAQVASLVGDSIRLLMDNIDSIRLSITGDSTLFYIGGDTVMVGLLNTTETIAAMISDSNAVRFQGTENYLVTTDANGNIVDITEATYSDGAIYLQNDGIVLSITGDMSITSGYLNFDNGGIGDVTEHSGDSATISIFPGNNYVVYPYGHDYGGGGGSYTLPSNVPLDSVPIYDVLGNIQHLSTTYLTNLDTFVVDINTVVFVGETNKNYYWNGITWNEITSNISITDNKISFSQSAFEEIVDYDQLDTVGMVSSNYFIVNSGTSPTLWSDFNTNTENFILAGNKRADLYYNSNQDTVYHLGGDLFSDYQIIYDTSLSVVSASSYGTVGRNNVHSVFIGNDKIYKSFITLGTFEVNGNSYSTVDNSDGFVIIENEDTYAADTVFPIFTGTGVQQTTPGVFDPYTNLIYFTGRTQNTEFIINSSDGNDTTITQANYSLTIAIYDTNFVLQDFYHMPTDNIANTNTKIYSTENYIYWMCAVKGTLTLPDETVLSTPSTNSNFFLIKFDKNFNVIYSRTLRSTGIVSGYEMEIDDNENVRVAYTRSTSSLDIQTGDSEYGITTNNQYGGTDAGEVTWDRNGDYVSYYEFGGTGNDLIQGSVQTKDYTIVSGYSNSTSLTIGDSTFNHGNTTSEGFIVYINPYTGNLIKGEFYPVTAASGTIRKIIGTVNNDYIYGVYVIDDPTADVTIGDSTYTSPGTGNNIIVPFKYGVEDYVKGLALNDETIFLGDYYNGKYVKYDTANKALTYVGSDNDFSGNQIPDVNWIYKILGDVDSIRLSISGDSTLFYVGSDTVMIGLSDPSSYNTIYVNNLEGQINDTIEINDNIDLNEGIRLRVDTISYAVSASFDFKGQATTQVLTMSGDMNLTIDMPIGSFYEIEVYQDGSGGHTLTVTGATAATNSEAQDETASAVSLYQFRKYASGDIYYWIANL
jgi:hypothetical protein